MATFSTKSFERKLKEMSARQDSVQTVSLWLIHHRAHSRAVVSVWHEHVKKVKPERRLILFYLANDVIQNSRKKGKEFSSSFSKVLLDSMSYLRDSQIRPSVERVLKIWQERKVFDKDVVQKLIAQLYRVSKPEPKVEVKASEKKAAVVKPKKVKRQVPTSFKVNSVVRSMVTMHEHETETQRRETKVSQMRLDASSAEGIKQLKDYAGGNRFSLEFEESSSKIEELVESLESENEHRHILINALEDSNAYYEAALKEATIIANAYRSFGNRLHAMKKKLDNKIRKFATAEKEAPVSAPKASFLASGLKGILKEMNRSPSGSVDKEDGDEKKEEEGESEIKEDKKEEGKEDNEKEKEKEPEVVKEEKVVDPTVDHVEVSDMDIESDSDEDAASDSVVAQETPETNSNTNDSALSTPTPGTPSLSTPTLGTPTLSTPVATESPSAAIEVPTSDSTKETVVEAPATSDSQPTTSDSQPTTGAPQPTTSAVQPYGYTMTVDSTEDPAGFSPASRDSAPSPEGSPDLDLEQYEKRFPDTEGLDAEAKQSIYKENAGNESDFGSQNSVNLLAHLISETRRRDESSAENSPQRDARENAEVIAEGLNMMNALFPGFQVYHEGNGEHAEDNTGEGALEGEHEGYDQSSEYPASQTIGDGDADNAEPSTSESEVLEAQALDQAHANEKPKDGDMTPEHGSDTPEFGEGTPEFDPIIIRAGAEFRRHPDLSSSSHGRLPDDHQLVAEDRQLFLRDRLPPDIMEPGPFIRDGIRRPSLDEAMIEERPPRGITSPGIRSPRMPADWDRWPRDGLLTRDRNDVIPLERARFPALDRRLDPRLRIRGDDPLRAPFRPGREDFERKPLEKVDRLEQFRRLEDFVTQPPPRRDFRPTDPRIERRLLGNRGTYPLSGRRDEARPIIPERDEFLETDAELLLRVRSGASADLDERAEDLQPPLYAREKAPLHPLDRREIDMLAERRELGPRGGGNLPPHIRPRDAYRGDPPTRGFYPRFSRPRGHPLPSGRPRGFPAEMRLKRPGPPFDPDIAKRPHF